MVNVISETRIMHWISWADCIECWDSDMTNICTVS